MKLAFAPPLARESGAIVLARADLLLAVYVLRALGYDVAYTEDLDGTRPSARLSAALRTFQGAANREQNRRLDVDGVLGNDTLNALAWYATHSPSAIARLRTDGLTTDEQYAVQRLIESRRNNAWGGGAGGSSQGGSSTPSRGGGSSTPSRTTPSTPQQAGMLAGGGKLLLGLLVAGGLVTAGTVAFRAYERRQEDAGVWAPLPYDTRAPSEPPPIETPIETEDPLNRILRRAGQKARGKLGKRS